MLLEILVFSRGTSDKFSITRLFCQAIFTDNCDSDRSALQATMAPASIACPDITATGSAASAPPLPALDFSADFTAPIPIVVRSVNCSLSALACQQLVEQAQSDALHFPGSEVVLGFDCEWAASLTSRRQVAVIQLSCVNGYTSIFQLKTQASRNGVGVMPNALKELMEDVDIQLVSVALKCCFFWRHEGLLNFEGHGRRACLDR